MTTVKMHEAKTNLSKLVARAEAGEEIIIARGGKPVVRLEPVDQDKRPAARGYGRFAHLRDKLPDNLFLEPMSEDELQAWEGKYSFPRDEDL